jgi:hypothetical protein
LPFFSSCESGDIKSESRKQKAEIGPATISAFCFLLSDLIAPWNAAESFNRKW